MQPEDSLQLSPEESAELLRWSRRVLREFLQTGRKPTSFDPSSWSPSLLQSSSVFVTLRRGEELRGCIGDISGSLPLAEAVARSTLLAASEDGRFEPVSLAEEPEIRIELSILSPFRPVAGPAEVQVGRHGLYLRRQSWSGLLLPQVAAERGWDAVAFLEHTALKAGLSPEGWMGAELFVFSARVLREEIYG